jgi:hypothetical protein
VTSEGNKVSIISFDDRLGRIRLEAASCDDLAFENLSQLLGCDWGLPSAIQHFP